ncbi:MAG: DUF885 domain-containing protein [Gammaproteobacteria bacterium]|nr:DUF885 domain-containing protein [Gammaproteobacteria bacterium]
MTKTGLPATRPLRLLLSAAVTAAVLTACGASPSGAADNSRAASTGQATTDVGAFFETFSDEWMLRRPSSATASRYFDDERQAEMDRHLTPMTEDFQRETVEMARQGLEQLARFDLAGMDDTQRVSAELMAWQLQVIVDGERFSHLQFPLNQFGGANVGLPNLMTVVHPVNSRQDADNYIARLGQFRTRMAEAAQRASDLGERGVLPPRFILEATISQMEQFIAPEPAENPLVATFAARLAGVGDLDESGRAGFIDRATTLVADEVYPAWRDAIAVLRSQIPQATDDAGLWRFEDGAEAYAYHLARFTSTDLDAEQIHELGLAEVARIEGEMDAILRSLGRTEGTVNERVAQLRQDLAYPLDDEGRAQIMADIETYMRDAERRADELFDIRPKTPVIAQPYPEFRWESAAASYTAPPLDGSRPGVYQMPLRANRMTNFGLRTLAYHEAVPGHHFQVALSVENTALPKFRQTRALGGISAFSEGWALYAERLAAEEGWYEGDPEGLLGQLDAELFRARRLVVDTGLHAKGWTRQQAIDYGIAPSEVDRYVVMPCQATSYKVGQLEMIRLRDKARDALGDAFDPREFHNRVLLTGVVPLHLLEREIDAYIEEARG